MRRCAVAFLRCLTSEMTSSTPPPPEPYYEVGLATVKADDVKQDFIAAKRKLAVFSRRVC